MDEDTIEMELTGEQEFALSQAASEGQRTADPVESASDAISPAFRRLYKRTARIDFICSLMFALAGVGITAAAVWPAADRSPPAVASTASVVPPLAAPAELQRRLVHVRNPFDSTEVFEFPAEITKAEA